mmetsp:Transcript_17287/g.29792  ORF Transcript_17287/g.29792 Transcript_17287/m.29792 type:complete len:253 (-) Transcript_17287:287-1045(-)
MAFALLAILAFAPPCESFTSTRAIVATRALVPPSIPCNKRFISSLNLLKQGDEEVDTVESEGKKEVGVTKNPLELASWYAVEAFGKAFGSKKSANDANDNVGDSIDLSNPPSSLEETLKRIQLDNDRSYFLSGEVDRFIYDEQCTFADPFVAFDGRDRFIDNLSNLGSFITNYDAKMIKYNVGQDGKEIDTKVMVKLELNLPWKPVLAWPWGVKYLVDPETCLVTLHEESWDIAPWEGVKQIFRPPTVKIGK